MDIYCIYIYRGKEYASVISVIIKEYIYSITHVDTDNGIPCSCRVPLSRRIGLVAVVSLRVVHKIIQGDFQDFQILYPFMSLFSRLWLHKHYAVHLKINQLLLNRFMTLSVVMSSRLYII